MKIIVMVNTIPHIVINPKRNEVGGSRFMVLNISSGLMDKNCWTKSILTGEESVGDCECPGTREVKKAINPVNLSTGKEEGGQDS